MDITTATGFTAKDIDATLIIAALGPDAAVELAYEILGAVDDARCPECGEADEDDLSS